MRDRSISLFSDSWYLTPPENFILFETLSLSSFTLKIKKTPCLKENVGKSQFNFYSTTAPKSIPILNSGNFLVTRIEWVQNFFFYLTTI